MVIVSAIILKKDIKKMKLDILLKERDSLKSSKSNYRSGTLIA